MSQFNCTVKLHERAATGQTGKVAGPGGVFRNVWTVCSERGQGIGYRVKPYVQIKGVREGFWKALFRKRSWRHVFFLLI